MDATAPLLPIPEAPEAAIRHLVRVIGHGFHPDTLGDEYARDDGRPFFSVSDASAIDGAVVKALAALGERAYEIAIDEKRKLP